MDGTYSVGKQRRYPKLSIITDCANHLICAVRTGRGPAIDVHQMKETFRTMPAGVEIKLLLGDAGYDSEKNHSYAREQRNIDTLIPPWHGRPSDKPASGKYRRQMQKRFSRKVKIFGQRWQVETTFSMLKRNLGAAVSARNYWSQSKELWLKVLTHNLAILAHSV